MVNASQTKTTRVVKFSDEPTQAKATGQGGIALFERLANRISLWKNCQKFVPARKDPTQGFSSTAVVCSLVYGLLCGGEGFEATEPLREDEPLLRIIGLKSAPSAETVEHVTKYLGACHGHKGLSQAISSQAGKLLSLEKRQELLNSDGFAEVWGDGSLLEVDGRNFEAVKTIDGKRGLMLGGAFIGPYLAAIDFAREGVGEQTLVRGFLSGPCRDLLHKLGLGRSTLVLLDSLYGDGPTLDELENSFAESRYIVGANKLVEVDTKLKELGENDWIKLPADPGRGWEENAVAALWIQCEEWSTKRLCVARRFRRKGQMIYEYSGVLTNLKRDDERVRRKMKREKIRFEEAVWRMYDRKQAREHNWKELLSDLGLHHPPSARVEANAVFYACAGLAYNLAVGVRRLGFEGKNRSMRLWRLRRDVIELPARVALHAREAVVWLLDARERLAEQARQAMSRLAQQT